MRTDPDISARSLAARPCRCELLQSAIEHGLADAGALEQVLDRLSLPPDNGLPDHYTQSVKGTFP